MQTYPATFPCVQINGYRLDAEMGAIRTEIPMSQVQRRVFRTMPHVIALSFVMTVPEWGTWQAWIKNNAYDWFTISLPSLYAGKSGSRMSPHVIRFTSPVVASNVTDSHVQVSVAAEMSPSMITQYLDAV
ncbi:MAG: hypothetical protein ACO3Z6_14940 [Pseudomonadales bacterium]